jgi:hypothetical protein
MENNCEAVHGRPPRFVVAFKFTLVSRSVEPPIRDPWLGCAKRVLHLSETRGDVGPPARFFEENPVGCEQCAITARCRPCLYSAVRHLATEHVDL